MNYMEKLINIIEDKLFEELSLESLAKEVNYSKYHISREFNTRVGVSISKYIQERRFTYAVQRLNDSFDTITNIAIECGFNSPAYFTKNFKERFGMTPKKYMTGRYYINLVERIQLGDIKMFNSIEEINKYIYKSMNDFESIQDLFASIENVIYEKSEDVNACYFALTESIDRNGTEGHILWYCKLNLLSGTSDCKIVRNTAFLPKVTIDNMYRLDDNIYLDVYNNETMTKVKSKIAKIDKKLYKTDLCRFSDDYLNEATHKEYQTLTENEIHEINEVIHTLIKTSKNNISFKKNLTNTANVQLLRMISEKALITYVINRKNTSSIVTVLIDLKNKKFRFSLEDSFVNFGKEASVEKSEDHFDVKLNNNFIAKLHLITGELFELYNSGYTLELEDGTKDIFAVGYM